MKEIAIGIDIGGTNTKYGIVDRGGRTLASGTASTPSFATPGQFVGAVADGIRECQKQVDKDAALRGIGIGAPNGNYYHGTIEHAPNLKWKGVVPLRDLFQKAFSLPVFVTNDANAAAIGEMIYGAAKGQRDFIVVTLGTGVGSGFVAGGDLIYGHDGFAGELGHMIIVENGRLCGCGRRGCLETYASATGVVATVRELLATSTAETPLRDVPPEQLTSKAIAEAAERGDVVALETFDFTAHKLAIGLANAVTVTSPKLIVLFGGLARAGKFILEPTHRYLEQNLFPAFKNKIQLVQTALDHENAAILGASAMVWQELAKKRA